MKIAFMMASYDTMYFFKSMADKLKDRGHTIKTFPAIETSSKGGRYGVEHCKWHLFEMEPILKYNPDRILIWNGFHNPFVAATMFLKSTFKLFHVEQAWLPQKGNIYIDSGIGGSSEIAKACPRTPKKPSPQEASILDRLRKLYTPDHFSLKLPEKFMLVPLQLEQDTSIVFDSPYFKTMDSLIGFALERSPIPIVIKPHPKELRGVKNVAFRALQDCDLKGITVIEDKDININALVHKSSAVLGINSTSLIEAAIHGKPITQLGNNVFGEAELKVLKGEWDFLVEPNSELYNTKLIYLAKNQFPILNPPTWVLDKIEEYEIRSRGLDEQSQGSTEENKRTEEE